MDQKPILGTLNTMLEYIMEGLPVQSTMGVHTHTQCVHTVISTKRLFYNHRSTFLKGKEITKPGRNIKTWRNQECGENGDPGESKA